MKKDDQAGPSAPRFVWGDRLLFAVVGLLLGFAAAYLYLDKQPPSPVPTDPHAGINQGAGATRDLPGSGGGAPQISADPAMRQRLSEIQAAVTRDPNNYDMLVQLGNAAYDVQDWRLAVDSYEKALKLKDGDPNVLTDLGVSYRSAGDSDKALSCFDRAVKSDPKHWQAQFNQAVVWGIDRKDKARAQAILDKLKKEHPDVPAIATLEETIRKA